jgi:hypothetical protein
LYDRTCTIIHYSYAIVKCTIVQTFWQSHIVQSYMYNVVHTIVLEEDYYYYFDYY